MALRMHPYGCGRKAIWVVEVYDRGDSFSHRIRDSNLLNAARMSAAGEG